MTLEEHTCIVGCAGPYGLVDRSQALTSKNSWAIFSGEKGLGTRGKDAPKGYRVEINNLYYFAFKSNLFLYALSFVYVQ